MKKPRIARGLVATTDASYASGGVSPSSIIVSVVAFFTVIVVLNSPCSCGKQAHWILNRPLQSLMLPPLPQPSSTALSGSAVVRPAVSTYVVPLEATEVLPYAKRPKHDRMTG